MEHAAQRRSKRRDRTDDHPREMLGTTIVVLLLAAAFVSAIAYGAVDTWTTGMLAVFGALIVVLWVAGGLKTRVFAIELSALYLPVVALILIGIVQLLPVRSEQIASEILGIPAASAISLDPYATRMFTVRLVILLVFFAAAFTFIDSKKRIENCALAIVIFGAAMAFFGILQRLSGAEAIYGLRVSPQAIPFGPFVNQHHFAAFMELTTGLAFGILIGRGVGRERRIVLAMAAMLMGIGVIFTGSRGGLISYVAVVAVAAVLTFLRSRDTEGDASVNRMAALAGGAAILFGVIATAFVLGGGEALFRGLAPGSADITSGRTHFWSVAWRIFLDHPFIGAGFDAFAVAFTRYDTWNGTFRIEQAHNDHLQTLADAGIAGFACLAAFIYLLARKSLNVIASTNDDMRGNIAIGALAGCAGILVHSIFDFPLRTTSNAIFFLLLVVLACASVEAKSGRSRSASR